MQQIIVCGQWTVDSACAGALSYWCMHQNVPTGTLGNLCTSSVVSTNSVWYIFVLAAWTYELGGHPREGGRPPVCVSQHL